jgi:hypothetical protein
VSATVGLVALHTGRLDTDAGAVVGRAWKNERDAGRGAADAASTGIRSPRVIFIVDVVVIVIDLAVGSVCGGGSPSLSLVLVVLGRFGNDAHFIQ